MSTDFDTFCMSKHGVFIESMLGVRGCAEEDCIGPPNVEGACCWEAKSLHGEHEHHCIGCYDLTATGCRQEQRRWEELGAISVRYEWAPYHACHAAGFDRPWDLTCADWRVEDTSPFWRECALEQGWCRLSEQHPGARATRDLCNELGGEYHDPYPHPPDWEPTLPCCVYTYAGTRCYQWSAGECEAAGGTIMGSIGDSCDGVGCPHENFWGACCSGDATCTDHVYPDDCTIQPGAIWYPCQNCEAIACEEGACCLPSGICDQGLTSIACGVLDGTFQGPATTCNDPEVDCVADITVACCRPDGTCHDSLSRRHCAAADGIVMGALSCADVPSCPESWGACCRDFGEVDAQCYMVHGDAVQMDCTDLGGTYMSHGTRCSELNCAEGVGACCKPSGICLDWPGMTRPTCEFIDPDNVFIGYGATCTPYTCDGPVGACCSLWGPPFCSVIPEGACTPQYGLWQGAGTTCESVLCPEKIGACCARTEVCYLTWKESCEQYQGIGAFQGAGSTCDDVDCGPTSSCCLPDGSCVTTGLMNCRTRGGAWNKRPPGWPPWNCHSTSCNSGRGACCVSERCLNDTLYEDCIDARGKFFGDGSVCGHGARQDCTPGACCLPDGTCEYWTQAWCENRGGEWRGDYGDYFPKCRDETGHSYDVDCSEPWP